MSDRVIQTNHDTDTKIRDPVHPYQSVYMSHSMGQGSTNSPKLQHDHIALGDESKGDDWNHRLAIAFAPTAEHGKSATSLVDEVTCDTSEYMNVRDYSGNLAVKKSEVPQAVNAIGGITKNKRVTYTNETQALEHSKTPQIPTERNIFPVSRPLLEDHAGSDFIFLQQGFKSRGTPVQSVMPHSYVQSKEYFAKASSAHMGRDCSYHIYSASLLCDSTKDNQLLSQNTGNIYSGDNTIFEKLHDPLTNHLSFPISIGERGKMMDVSPYSGFLPGQTSPLEITKLEESNHGCCSSFRAPTYAAHNVETMRTCTTVDCLEGVPGGQSKFSQTTHHMLITKKSGIHISEEDQMIRKSTLFTESKGTVWPKQLGLLPDFDFHVEHEVVMRSKDKQGKEGVGAQTDSLGTNIESSADTDIMDTNVFHTRNNLLGINSSLSTKDVTVEQIPEKYQVASPSREVGRRKREFTLPDMNEMPHCSASESTMENIDFNTSRTESLDMEYLISQVVHVERLTSNSQQNNPQRLDPRSIWMKRTKISRSEDASYTENISTLLNKNMDISRTTTEPTSSKHLGEEHMDLGKNMMLSRNREPSCMVLEKEQRDPTLSHSWIRRWCRNVADAPTIKSSGKPQRSNRTSDALKMKQLPSIAAMALMGKAMSGLQACEFKNKGSFVVWSSGEFENT